jgi:prepilin-type processing-associated H-X9-DG protein
MSFLSTATVAQMNDPAFTRTMNRARKGAELIMVVEAANNNWYDQGDAYPWLPRLGARHGRKTADGLNAFTNFAFFDGHVALYPSADFQGPNKDMPDRFYQGTIFYLNKQQR